MSGEITGILAEALDDFGFFQGVNRAPEHFLHLRLHIYCQSAAVAQQLAPALTGIWAAGNWLTGPFGH